MTLKWWGRWVCKPCNIDEVKKFKTKDEAERWCKEQEDKHLIGGVHVSVSDIKL